MSNTPDTAERLPGALAAIRLLWTAEAWRLAARRAADVRAWWRRRYGEPCWVRSPSGVTCYRHRLFRRGDVLMVSTNVAGMFLAVAADGTGIDLNGKTFTWFLETAPHVERESMLRLIDDMLSVYDRDTIVTPERMEAWRALRDGWPNDQTQPPNPKP
jgi:hypothetical protein